MTVINAISPALLQNYIAYQKTDKLDLEQTFKNLSIEMGGDGKSITKDQLNSYVENAKDEKNVSNVKLSALKSIQENWSSIAGDKDSINFGDMSKFTSVLGIIAADNATSSTTVTAATTADSSKNSFASDKKNVDVYSYLVNATGASTTSGVTQTDLTSTLSALLADTSGDSDNSNKIALLTNLIADFPKLSGGTGAITQNSLDASKGFEA